MSETVVLSQKQDVLARTNTDGTVAIMRLDNDEHFFVLDGIAAEFWTMIDGRSTLATLKERLIKKHRPPEAKFERDVTGLVEDLLAEKLVFL